MLHPLIDALTLEEKAALLTGGDFWETATNERVGIKPAVLTDGPHGVRRQSGDPDHLGINDSLPSTAFPPAAATGSTWDPELLERIGAALGQESRHLGVDVLLGPGVNIKRSPLCGRNFEYFSEDPLLAGKLGAAWVRGIESRGVGASVKHFAVNNQETDRQRVSAEVDERTLREIYLPAFETTVREANPATLMCSYNRINGTFAAENHWLLTEVLRGDWGFEGYVMSDWGAVTDAPTSAAAGLDLAMPTSLGRGPKAIVAAVNAGDLDEEVVDTAASRILFTHDRLFAAQSTDTSVDWDAHHALAREAAAAGTVLLKNDDSLLPLDPATGGDIAIIGEFARTPRYQGAGSSHINPTRLDSALDAITTRSARRVRFAPGFTVPQDNEARPDDAAQAPGVGHRSADELYAEAVEAARGADVSVVFLGLPAIDESEGYDRTHLFLPREQLRVLAGVAEVSERVVVLLSNGGVVSLDGIDRHAHAILETWLSGQAGGSAAADVLFGDAEPGGRLAETIPLRLEDTPSFLNFPGAQGKVYHGERVYVGYRYFDTVGRDVAYPFGHGLGYTSFEYSELRVSADHTGGLAEVSVRNTGRRAGSTVVQAYVHDVEASVDRPEKELAAFAKVTLNAGESTTVRLTLPERAFSYWGKNRWILESGEFHVWVGESSRNLRLSASLTIDIPGQEDELDVDSTLGDWVAHPRGKSVLEAALTRLHPQARNLTEGETLRLSSSIPLRQLIAMAGSSEPNELVDELLAQLV